jgi:hypothetical protein
MAKRTVASGGVAVEPLPKKLRELRSRLEDVPEDDEEREEGEESSERKPREEEDPGTRVASADGEWAKKLKPALLERYQEERAKGPRNIDNAVRVHNILNMLEKEEKLPAPMSERLDKMVRPKRRK